MFSYDNLVLTEVVLLSFSLLLSRSSRVKKSSYEIVLRSMTSYSELLFQKFLQKFFFFESLIRLR